MRAKRSVFAKALKAAMMDTGVGEISSWAHVLRTYQLDVDKNKILDWFTDKTFPSPLELATILVALERTIAINSKQMVFLGEVLFRPIEDVTPIKLPKHRNLVLYIQSGNPRRKPALLPH